jgi:hypothetical protein
MARKKSPQEEGFRFVSQAIEFSLLQELVDEREARRARPALYANFIKA